MDEGYASIDFTETFLREFASREFSAAEKAAFLRAIRLMDDNQRHPSLRVHQLRGDREGSWSASASSVLRLTFERPAGGRTRMLTCSRHYDT